jgi:predicted metalloprotease with PDZ domain
MDDFAKAFFGIDNGSRKPVGYTFDDVVAALNAVVPYDWTAFLRARLDARDTTPVFDALARAGWRLAYADEPTDFFRAREIRLRRLMMMAGPGFDVDNERNPGALLDVRWASPAFDAGLVPGMKLIAVNGERYTSDVLRDALKTAKGATGTNPPIELLVQLHDTFSTLKLEYRDGPRYPRLERLDGTPDRLEAILKARR